MSRSNPTRCLPLSLKGFTLVEVLIAVGAVSLIAIGLARVFSATGDTVRAGRRLSHLNEYASMLERQFRDDVASMTRDGFLVIRQRETADASGPIDVLLSPDQRMQFERPRRVDELMFFASGRFSSLRDPIHPGRVPTGTAARIYYGHGLRNDPSDELPTLDLHSAIATMQSSFGDPGGPNEYAADWILLRHITTLSAPQATEQSPLSNVTQPTLAESYDNDIQLGLQPAASSIFMVDALNGPATPPGDGDIVRDGEGVVLPQFSSGIVDLATTTLSEIRNHILDAQEYPGTTGIQWNPTDDDSVDGMDNWFAYQRDADPMNFANNPSAVTSNMKRWMAAALPAGYPTNPFNTGSDRRMRCELAPPNLLGVINGGTPWAANQPWKRVDQMMLCASNFVPHCSEFIVEWSFGKIDIDSSSPNFGQPVWYGIERHADPLDINSATVALPYHIIDPEQAFNQSIPLRNNQSLLRRVRPALIHYPPIDSALPARGLPLYSCFGYVDPTYPDAGFETDAQQRYPSTIPWAWPKLLRITISLVDPSDPLRETTFQFIIEIPEAKLNRF